jgi:hypothetical protein
MTVTLLFWLLFTSTLFLFTNDLSFYKPPSITHTSTDIEVQLRNNISHQFITVPANNSTHGRLDDNVSQTKNLIQYNHCSSDHSQMLTIYSNNERPDNAPPNMNSLLTCDILDHPIVNYETIRPYQKRNEICFFIFLYHMVTCTYIFIFLVVLKFSTTQ